MRRMLEKLRVGFIPLVDSAALLIAVDKGYAADEGLEVELVREVSWANVREKLHAGHFDAAHMLTPMAIASTLGLGQVKTQIVAPLTLAMNGNAITVSLALHDEITAVLGKAEPTPAATATALLEVIRRRQTRGLAPVTFGMTFPFSSHNYQLRFWMASADIDPDEDARLLVLPPPYMVESLRKGQVDGFCVGAPWNSLAVDNGIGRILHFGADIMQRLAEKMLAVRSDWADANEDVLIRLIRAVMKGASYLASPENHLECANLLAHPHRIGVDEDLIHRALSGVLKIGPNGETRTDRDYLLPGAALVGRPNETHAAWIYSQMVRWRQAKFDASSLRIARKVFSPELFDKSFDGAKIPYESWPADGLGAFHGPAFVADDIAAYLAACGGVHPVTKATRS